MDLKPYLLERAEIPDFARSGYASVFSVFMVIIAYLYKGDGLVTYPDILFLFLSLLAVNFSFNRLIRSGKSITLGALNAVLLANILIVTAILAKSGYHLSYFWVLYLLPIFTPALTGRLPELAAATALSILALGLCSAAALRETAFALSLAVKIGVFLLSSFAIYRAALARKSLEAEVSSKREQVEALIKEIAERNSKALADYSAAEAGRLSSGLLHDIGNMLSVVLGISQLLEAESPGNRDLGKIVRAASMARTMIFSTLKLIKGGDYDFEPCGIGEPINNSMALFEYPARHKGVAVSVSLENGLPELSLSILHIQRALLNVLFNALSFLNKGGGLKVSARRDGGFVLVSVEDNGPGFPPELLSSGIAAYRSIRKDKTGTGLGLFGAADTMKKHGGELAIRNRAPSGAVVEFRLPVPAPDTRPPSLNP